MSRLESRIVGAFIAILVPACCFFAAWWLCVGHAGTAREEARTRARDLEHMFHLKFTVTRPMIVALVAAGWPALVLCQHWLARKAAYAAYGGDRRVGQTE